MNHQTNVEPLLKVERLRKSFGAHEVLCGIDVAVMRGDVTCIVGPRARARARSCAASTISKSPPAVRSFCTVNPSACAGRATSSTR